MPTPESLPEHPHAANSPVSPPRGERYDSGLHNPALGTGSAGDIGRLQADFIADIAGESDIPQEGLQGVSNDTSRHVPQMRHTGSGQGDETPEEQFRNLYGESLDEWIRRRQLMQPTDYAGGPGAQIATVLERQPSGSSAETEYRPLADNQSSPAQPSQGSEEDQNSLYLFYDHAGNPISPEDLAGRQEPVYDLHGLQIDDLEAHRQHINNLWSELTAANDGNRLSNTTAIELASSAAETQEQMRRDQELPGVDLTEPVDQWLPGVPRARSPRVEEQNPEELSIAAEMVESLVLRYNENRSEGPGVHNEVWSMVSGRPEFAQYAARITELKGALDTATEPLNIYRRDYYADYFTRVGDNRARVLLSQILTARLTKNDGTSDLELDSRYEALVMAEEMGYYDMDKGDLGWDYSEQARNVTVREIITAVLDDRLRAIHVQANDSHPSTTSLRHDRDLIR